MNAVLGFTDLAIQAGNDTAKIQDYLKKIRISGNHLLGIVNEVLEISRIESGQTKLEETVCSIIDIVNETDVIIREQAGYGNYEIHVKDNGCGMSREFLEKIFVPFERQNNSTISGIQGTGLELDKDMPLCRCLLTDAFCLYIPLFCTWTLLYGRCIMDENYMIKIMEA